MQSQPLRPGDPESIGAYQIVGRLGAGGQGAVYLGRSVTGSHVAIKLLFAEVSGDAPARERFVREVAAARRVARFCTAQMLEVGVLDDRPYIISEYVAGPSLQDSVRSGGPQTGGRLERLAIGTATALAAIHAAGVVHRDLKPMNVLLGPDGPRVIDFGIARALDVTSVVTAKVVGTPAYMAPEQIAGSVIGPKADVFAWGGTILFAANGRLPFVAESIPATFHRILNGEPDYGNLSGALREMVGAALAKNPADRRDSLKKLFEAVGGRFIDLYYCLGEYDGVVIAEAPDDASVVSALVAVVGAGHIKSIKTTKLLTPEEMVGALGKAGQIAFGAPK
jgi:serine/threonine protein kinase